MTKVAILGGGPAGLLAAHGVALAKHEPTIFSVKKKSIMPGTMYIHRAIPLISDAEPDGMLRYIKRGTRSGYAGKVYGHPNAPCSWDEFAGSVRAWSMVTIYDRLWAAYSHLIKDGQLDRAYIDTIANEFPVVISTIPAPQLCHGDRGCEFPRRTMYVKEMAEPGVPDDSILYNGTWLDHWYRSSRIFGREATETTYPSFTAHESGWRRGEKPMWNNCECRSNIDRAGRFGEWKRGVLAHHAFEKGVKLGESLHAMR